MGFEHNYAAPDRYMLLKEFAKKNKQYPTEAERLMWEHLRSKQLWVKFNSQYIIADYIVDFVCLDRKLIVEVDGGYHSEYEQMEKDVHRTERLERLGFSVLRFSNEEVLTEIEDVLEVIRNELYKI